MASSANAIDDTFHDLPAEHGQPPPVESTSGNVSTGRSRSYRLPLRFLDSEVGRTEERSDNVPAIDPVPETQRCRSFASLDPAYFDCAQKAVRTA